VDDVSRFRLSQRREAPPPTHVAGCDEDARTAESGYPARSCSEVEALELRIQPSVGCSRGSCCQLGGEQSVSHVHVVVPGIGRGGLHRVFIVRAFIVRALGLLGVAGKGERSVCRRAPAMEKTKMGSYV
jgi:hypothetical protein